jgi:hypothetical protein
VGQTTKKGIDKSNLLWYNIGVRKRGNKKCQNTMIWIKCQKTGIALVANALLPIPTVRKR